MRRGALALDPAAAWGNALPWKCPADDTPESDLPEAPEPEWPVDDDAGIAVPVVESDSETTPGETPLTEPERDSFVNPFEPDGGSASDGDPLPDRVAIPGDEWHDACYNYLSWGAVGPAPPLRGHRVAATHPLPGGSTVTLRSAVAPLVVTPSPGRTGLAEHGDESNPEDPFVASVRRGRGGPCGARRVLSTRRADPRPHIVRDHLRPRRRARCVGA